MELRLGTAEEWRAWIKRGRLFWFSVALAAAGALWWSWSNQTQDAARQLGLIYEFVGVAAVIAEIYKTSTDNRLGSPITRFCHYLRLLPLLPRQQITGTVNVVEAGQDTCSVAGFVPMPTTDLSRDERLQHLEGRMDGVESAQSAIRATIKAEIASIAAALKEEASQRHSAVAVMDANLRKAQTGGLDLALFGVFWLMVGMVGTTATPEVCRWILVCRPTGCQ